MRGSVGYECSEEMFLGLEGRIRDFGPGEEWDLGLVDGQDGGYTSSDLGLLYTQWALDTGALDTGALAIPGQVCNSSRYEHALTIFNH